VLVTLRAVEVWRLRTVLEVPDHKWLELKQSSANDEEWRERTVLYFLQTHPLAGWEMLGGELLGWEEHTALEKVKVHIKPEDGTYVLILMNTCRQYVKDFHGLALFIIPRYSYSHVQTTL
jgi:hypothetical protein